MKNEIVVPNISEKVELYLSLEQQKQIMAIIGVKKK